MRRNNQPQPPKPQVKQPAPFLIDDYIRPCIPRSIVLKMKRIFDKFDFDKEGLVDLIYLRSIINGLNLSEKSPRGTSII